MTDFEKASIIGYYRQGASFETISYIMGISESYAKLIVTSYLATKEKEKR